MKIAVISDLHIGKNQETHQLGHSDHDFALFLYELEKKYDKIILLGDIYEVDMDLDSNQEKVISDCITAHPTITRRFSNEKYVYIFGNHDLIGEKIEAKERFQLTYSGMRILFIHGHQFDDLYKISHLSFFGGLILKLNMKSLYKWISEKARFGNFSLETENKKFESKAFKYAKENNYDVIVTGHTHHPRIIKEDEVTFLNSGTCTYGRICYLHMDLDNNKYYIKDSI